MEKFLSRVLRVHPKEQKPFLLLALTLFAMMAGLEIVSNIAELTFVKRVGVEFLPRLYSIEPIILIGLLLFFGSIIDRFGRYRVLFTLNSGLILALLFARALMQANWYPIFPLVWLAQRIFYGLAPLSFWVLCNDIFDIRQSKRLFPTILAASLAGITLGNLLTGLLSTNFSAEDVLFAAIIMFGVSLGAIEGVRRLNLPSSFVHVDTLSDKKVSITLPRHLLAQPFLQALFLLMFILGALEPVLRYELTALANQTFSAEQSLISFIGLVKAGGAFLIVAFQLLVAGRLLDRMGVPTTLSILPIGFLTLLPLLGFFPNIFIGSFVVATLASFAASFHGPARNSALNLFPPDERGRISAFADQLWYVGWFVNSLFLSWASTHLTLTQINFVGAGIAALWLFILPSIKQRYITTCLKNAALPIDEISHSFTERGMTSTRFNIEEGDTAVALHSASPHRRRQGQRSLLPRLAEHSYNAKVIAAQLKHTSTLTLLTAPLESELLWGKIRVETEQACLTGVLELLEFTHPRQQLRTVARMVRSDLPAMRAAGVEALESLIQLNGYKQQLILLLTETALEEKRRHIQRWLKLSPAVSREAALQALSEFADPLVRFWSRQHLAQHKDNLVELAQHIDLLRRARAFASLTEEELHVLAASAQRHQFAAGKLIHEEGQPSQRLYVVAQGEVELESVVRRQAVRRVGASDTFGDLSLLGHRPYALTAMALTEVTVLSLERDTLQELIGFYPNIALGLMRDLAWRLGQAHGLWREES